MVSSPKQISEESEDFQRGYAQAKQESARPFTEAHVDKLEDDLEIAIEALKKSKSEWEIINAKGFKHMVAWQMCRDALAKLGVTDV
jgi:hypothetical protein